MFFYVFGGHPNHNTRRPPDNLLAVIIVYHDQFSCLGGTAPTNDSFRESLGDHTKPFAFNTFHHLFNPSPHSTTEP